MAATYKSIHLVSRPTGDIDPEKQFKLVESPRPTESDLKDGEILIENLYLSLDPAMRGWMNDRRSYVPPVALNTPMRGGTIARIQASKSADHKPGDHVVCMGNWTEFAIVAGKDTEAVAVPPDGGRLTDVLGPLGMTGMTAYFGLLDVGQPKAGETVVVSGAAGATGSVVCQIAKIKGCRVVGIAGSQDKVQWLRELGCDVALDYKSTEFEREFKEATKEYIDVFFDNVGGPILEAALARAKPHARFVICGAISQYNSTDPRGPKNYFNVIAMRIRMQGFIVFDYRPRFAEGKREIAAWLSAGKLQRKEHIVTGGLEVAPQALTTLYSGANTGKMLVEIKSPKKVSTDGRGAAVARL